MLVRLAPGESVAICFTDDDTELQVNYDGAGIAVKADKADSYGRVDTVYHENYAMRAKS